MKKAIVFGFALAAMFVFGLADAEARCCRVKTRCCVERVRCCKVRCCKPKCCCTVVKTCCVPTCCATTEAAPVIPAVLPPDLHLLVEDQLALRLMWIRFLHL